MKIKNILLVSIVSLGLLAFTFNQNTYKTIKEIPEIISSIDTSKAKDRFEDKVYDVVEIHPEYPGGSDAMFKFISENFNYPEEARKNNITGRVLVSFVVDKNGKVRDIKPTLPTERQLGHGLEGEAIRVVSLMPDWNPGTQKGEAVNVRNTLPFYCTLDRRGFKKKK